MILKVDLQFVLQRTLPVWVEAILFVYIILSYCEGFHPFVEKVICLVLHDPLSQQQQNKIDDIKGIDAMMALNVIEFWIEYVS